MDELKCTLEKQMDVWRIRLVTAGYKACCKDIIQMIDDNTPLEDIKKWCGDNHKKTEIVEDVMYKGDDNIDKD